MSVDGLSLAEAAKRLGLSVKTVRRRVVDGTYPAHKVHTVRGYVWRVDLDLPAVVPVGQGSVEVDEDVDLRTLRREVVELRAIVMSRQALVSSPVHLPREEIACAPGHTPVQVDEGRLRRLWAWLWEERP